MTYDPIHLENEIKMYYHCGLCLQEKPDNKSPQEWGMNEVGATKIGVQVWCKRHDCNVVHIDFEGQKFEAYVTRKPRPGEKPLPLSTPEQVKEYEEKSLERKTRRMFQIMDGMIHGSPEAFAAVLPTVLAVWIHFNCENDQERKEDLKNLVEAVELVLKEMKETIADE